MTTIQSVTVAVTTTTKMSQCVIDDQTVSEISPNITMYGVNIIVASICMVAVCMNFGVLISCKKFRQQYLIIIVLCVAEIIAVLGIILEATTRRELFSKAIETRTCESVTSRDCLQPWVLCQTISDFWVPSLEFLMGLERMCAVVFPTVFRKFFAPNINILILLASLFASGFTIVPTAITLIWPSPNVRWSCGRKAAYGANFGILDYSYNVIGFTAAFIFNIVALISSMKVQQSGRNMAKLKCYTAIAFLSTLLISIPNLLSIINVFVEVPNILLTPAPILACANGAVQFIVYLTFNPEFLQRFVQLITFNQVKNIIKIKPPPNFTQVPTTSTKVTPSTASKATV